MDRRRFELLEALFHEVEGLDEGARRERIARVRSEDPELASELEDLVGIGDGERRALEELAGRFVDAVERETAGEQESLETSPTQDSHAPFGEGRVVLGRYRLVERLGVGGMGEVWSAEQTDVVTRRVAVKLLRQTHTGSASVLRFETERQALALLEHPNIARVIDAGEEDGLPLFVMELVEDGVAITEYCRAHELDLDARLRLFVAICGAVEHAHRKRIIHRDLKPSNVLVSATSAPHRVTPKVIDFGIAKPIEEVWKGSTQATRVGELIGTPEYMSPEQASLGAVDIDTRSDVYSLGLLLFELVAGQQPVASQELRKLPFDELCRRIREDDTPRPSTLLRKSDPSTAPLGAGLAASTWRRVQGDLDRILGKALAKDRDQRYGSAAELAEDIGRFLRFEPVHATAPSRAYRLAKFVRRNRLWVAASTFLVVGLIVGLSVAVVGFRRARAAEVEARTSLRSLERSSEFLVGLFAASNPAEARGEDPPASELLRRGLEKLDSVEDDPSVLVRLLESLGEVQLQRGSYPEAEDLLVRALELRVEGGGASDPVREAFVHLRLGDLDREQERFVEGEAHYERAIELLEAHAPEERLLGVTLNALGINYRKWGRGELAAETLERVLAVTEQEFTADSVPYASVLFNVATARAELRDDDNALASGTRSLEIFERHLPEDHPNFGIVHSNLAVWSRRSGRLACAKLFSQRAVEIDTKVLPEHHPSLGDSHYVVGTIAVQTGELELAREHLARALEIYKLSLGEDSYKALLPRAVSGDIAFLDGNPRRAVEIYRDVAESLLEREASKSVHQLRMTIARKLSTALRGLALARPQLGAATLEQASEAQSVAAEMAALLEDPSATAQADLVAALIAAQQERREAALELLQRAEQAAGCDDTQPGQHCSLDDTNTTVFRAQLWPLLGEPERALESVRKAVVHDGASSWLVRTPELQLEQVRSVVGGDLEELDARLRSPAEDCDSASQGDAGPTEPR